MAYPFTPLPPLVGVSTIANQLLRKQLQRLWRVMCNLTPPSPPCRPLLETVVVRNKALTTTVICGGRCVAFLATAIDLLLQTYVEEKSFKL